MSGRIIAALLAIAILAIGFLAWRALPRYEMVLDGLMVPQSMTVPSHPGVIVTDRWTGNVDWCHYYVDRWICEAVRYPPKAP